MLVLAFGRSSVRAFVIRSERSSFRWAVLLHVFRSFRLFVRASAQTVRYLFLRKLVLACMRTCLHPSIHLFVQVYSRAKVDF